MDYFFAGWGVGSYAVNIKFVDGHGLLITQMTVQKERQYRLVIRSKRQG